MTGFPNGRKAALVARARAAQLCCEQLGESCNPGLEKMENLGESGEIKICPFCRKTLKYVTFRRKTQKYGIFVAKFLTYTLGENDSGSTLTWRKSHELCSTGLTMRLKYLTIIIKESR